MTVVPADVIATELARAKFSPTSTSGTPARATRLLTPARATQTTESITAAPARAKVLPTPTIATPARSDLLTTIRLLGRTLDDLQKLRIQNELRIGAAKRDGIDAPWAEQIDVGMRAVEHAAELELKRAWRRYDHPAVAWAKSIPGAGETLMARLFSEIGDPAERPNPDKLRAYCGHGDPARAGRVPKNATQEELFKRGNPNAKKAVWKLAYQFMRTVGTPDEATGRSKSTGIPPRRVPRSPYRDIYDDRKAVTEGKLHTASCLRCGPAGHPALPGSPWSDAHRHADALRIVGKRFLVDLWIASRRVSV